MPGKVGGQKEPRSRIESLELGARTRGALVEIRGNSWEEANEALGGRGGKRDDCQCFQKTIRECLSFPPKWKKEGVIEKKSHGWHSVKHLLGRRRGNRSSGGGGRKASSGDRQGKGGGYYEESNGRVLESGDYDRVWAWDREEKGGGSRGVSFHGPICPRPPKGEEGNAGN